MKTTLLTHPENFFAYNNGLTVTASGIKTKEKDGSFYITELDNMQIVNGGQTTSSIYFAPLEKGTQKGIDFRNIDLSKVFVQMKLASLRIAREQMSLIQVFMPIHKIEYKQQLGINHPFHKKIEDLSRSTNVPAGELGIATNGSTSELEGSMRLRYVHSNQQIKRKNLKKNIQKIKNSLRQI